MLLLSSMSALFGKQDSDVEYAAEASIPSNNIAGIEVHHESLEHMKLHQTVKQIGATATGELMFHENGNTLDVNAFEDLENDMEDHHV